MTALQQAPATTIDIDVVVPVHNEQADLPCAVRRLSAYLGGLPYRTLITVANNASTDATLPRALALAAELPGVRVVHLDAKGRGRALREVWTASTADVVAYMDVDLSTELSAFLPLVAPLLSGHGDIAIGSRLSRTARVVRGPKRELISRGYNLLLRTTRRARFSDAQCGFKAMRTACARALLPHVHDGGWFFDTELLVLAERGGAQTALLHRRTVHRIRQRPDIQRIPDPAVGHLDIHLQDDRRHNRLRPHLAPKLNWQAQGRA